MCVQMSLYARVLGLSESKLVRKEEDFAQVRERPCDSNLREGVALFLV